MIGDLNMLVFIFYLRLENLLLTQVFLKALFLNQSLIIYNMNIQK